MKKRSRAREQVVLVDREDRELGTAPKLQAHQGTGKLHRAISVFIFNQGRTLLQQRARAKYHFPGQWANACCSHPQPGELPIDAAEARLHEELGFTCPLRSAGILIYRAKDRVSGLVEHELDHLFCGVYDGPVRPNLDEVRALEWIEPRELIDDVKKRPGRYTPWFRAALPGVLRWARAHKMV